MWTSEARSRKALTILPCSLILLAPEGAGGTPEQPCEEAHMDRNGGFSPAASTDVPGM